METDDKQEVQNSFDEATGILYKVFLPILLLTFGLGFFYQESPSYIEGKYMEINRLEYNGTVVKKSYSGGRYPHYLILRTGMEVSVDAEIYRKVKIGDSLSKEPNSDSITFFTRYFDTIYEDLNRYNREDYLKIKKR